LNLVAAALVVAVVVSEIQELIISIWNKEELQ
jgi:hypothetical protein